MIETRTLLEKDPHLGLVLGEETSLVRLASNLWPTEDSLVFVQGEHHLKQLGAIKDCEHQSYSLVIGQELYDLKSDDLKEFKSVLVTEHFHKTMCTLSKIFYDELYANLNYFVDGRQLNTAKVDPYADIAQGVFIGENCTIEKNVVIMPGVTIMPEVTIKEGTTLYPNITVYPYTTIGKNCRIHSQSVIGSDGFGYHFFEGKHHKIWHSAGVEIGDDVEIGAGSYIDTGCFLKTRVGVGTKIDNQVQISHNSQVGKHCVFCGRSGIAGSCQVEDYVVFAAGSGSAPHAHIGAGSKIAAAAIISEKAKIPPKSVMAGHPARPLKEWLRTKAKINQLTKK